MAGKSLSGGQGQRQPRVQVDSHDDIIEALKPGKNESTKRGPAVAEPAPDAQ